MRTHDGTTSRIGRTLAAAAFGIFAAMLVSSPAAAHGQDAPVATDYRVTVTAVEPATANVRVRAVEGGSRLELTNLSTAARAAGEAPARAWSVPLLLDGAVPAVIRGTVQQVPPPNRTAWWGASLAAAALLATLGFVRASLGRLFAGLAAVTGGLAIALTTGLDAPPPVMRSGWVDNQGMSRRGWWVVAGAVGAVVLVAASLAGVWRWDASRDPQVRDSVAAMDRGVADVLIAAGDDAAVAVSGMVRAATCSLGVLRGGGRYTRTADLYVAGGQEDATITRIEQRLPASDQPQRDTPLAPGSTRPLIASPGQDVQLSVRQLGPGWLVAAAQTGCVAGPAQPADASPAPGDPAVAAIRNVLAGLGTAAAGFNTTSVPCPGGPAGRQLVTVAGFSTSTDSGRLAERVAVPQGARTFEVSASNRIAYRDGAVSTVVDASDDGTAVTVRRTSAC